MTRLVLCMYLWVRHAGYAYAAVFDLLLKQGCGETTKPDMEMVDRKDAM